LSSPLFKNATTVATKSTYNSYFDGKRRKVCFENLPGLNRIVEGLKSMLSHCVYFFFISILQSIFPCIPSTEDIFFLIQSINSEKILSPSYVEGIRISQKISHI